MSDLDLAGWLARLEILHPAGIALGLDRVEEVRRRMGLVPRFPVVLVAGTNGKGSVSTWLAGFLRAQGLRTGLYTSPHLMHYAERVRVDGQEIDEASLIRSFSDVDAGRGDVPLTYFEFGTLAAVRHFISENVDIAVLEVGLGGRLDAVNVFEPAVSVLTNVDLDHQDWLGTDIEAIGREKAGIFRSGVPAVCGQATPPASVVEIAAGLDAPLWRAEEHFRVEMEGGGYWNYRSENASLDHLPPPVLPGGHQRGNAALALAACEALGMFPDWVQASSALREASLPGRQERRRWRAEWWLDVAHNPHAARLLADSLRQAPTKGKTYAVLAMLADKDAAGVAAALDPLIDHWFLAGLKGARGMEVDQLAEKMKTVLTGSAAKEADVCGACRRAWEAAGVDDRIVVFGSFLTVAEASSFLEDSIHGAADQ